MSWLPALGPRGEGWVVGQTILLSGVALAGFAGPAWSGPARIATTVAGLAGIAGGVALVLLGSRALGRSLTPLPHPREQAELVDDGIYGVVRHPIYGGVALSTIGWGLVTASPLALALAATTIGFYVLKSEREEAWLVERFPGYAAYRRRTRRLLPGVW